jgi:hypothetical protein
MHHHQYVLAHRAAAALGALGLLLGLSACDLPSAPPKWETTWTAPVSDVHIAVADLLPAGITVDGSAFAATFSGASASISLGEACAECAAANGFVVPKPAFEVSVSGSGTLAADVGTVTLDAGNALTVTLTHTFNFDPIRPGGDATGRIILTVASGTWSRQAIVDGATQQFPANTPLVVAVPLPTNGVVQDSIALTAHLESPAGDPVSINTTQRFTASGTLSPIRIASGHVRVKDQTVTATTSLNLADVASDIASRAQAAEFRLRLDNPFSVAGDALLDLAVPGQTISNAFRVAPGAQTVQVALSGDQIRALLGHEVTATLRATLSATDPTGLVSVSPKQTLVASNRVFITLRFPDAK